MTNRIRTSLQNKQAKEPWNSDEIKSQAAKLWHNRGTIMVMTEWLIDDFDKQYLINVAEKLFGKREGEK